MALSNDYQTQFWAIAKPAIARGLITQELAEGMSRNVKKSGTKYWGTTIAKLRMTIREAENGTPATLPDWKDRARVVGLEDHFIAWVLYQRTGQGPVPRAGGLLYKVCGTREQAMDAVTVLEDKGLIIVTRDRWGVKEVQRAPAA